MLITEKTYCFENSDGRKLTAYIREFFTVESQTVFTWPCAILLASFISSTDVVKGHNVVELGAGCGLPSIIAAFSGARSCLITERAEEPSILENLQLNVKKNGLLDICKVMSLDWKSPLSTPMSQTSIILGADVFYSSEDFESIMSLVDRIMITNPDAVFYTTYQERSTRRNISPYLDKYSMRAELIPSDTFLHPVHPTSGSCTIVEQKMCVLNSPDLTLLPSETLKGCQDTKTAPIAAQIKTVPLLTFDCMSLLKITRKS